MPRFRFAGRLNAATATCRATVESALTPRPNRRPLISGGVPQGRTAMAKGQKRSGREAKKPKASKTAGSAAPPGFAALRPQKPLPPKTTTEK